MAQIIELIPSIAISNFPASPVSLTNGYVVPKTPQKVCGVEGDEQQSEHFIIEERLVLLEKSALVSILFLKRLKDVLEPLYTDELRQSGHSEKPCKLHFLGL